MRHFASPILIFITGSCREPRDKRDWFEEQGQRDKPQNNIWFTQLISCGCIYLPWSQRAKISLVLRASYSPWVLLWCSAQCGAPGICVWFWWNRIRVRPQTGKRRQRLCYSTCRLLHPLEFVFPSDLLSDSICVAVLSSPNSGKSMCKPGSICVVFTRIIVWAYL